MIELIKHLIDLFLHIDRHLQDVIAQYGLWTYALLFIVIFAETGLVVTPFLPGDSLLFAAGALAVGSVLNVHLLVLLLAGAAVLGNVVNYAIGAYLGPKVFTREDSWLLRKKHLERAHAFFETYGGRSIILTRFMPIIRTFVPFVAGVARMPYPRFFIFNLVGGCAWIAALTYAGYYFGQIEVVRKNFSIVVLGIIVVSLLPMVFELIRAWWQSRGKIAPPSIAR
jgi:membrane-associated protein